MNNNPHTKNYFSSIGNPDDLYNEDSYILKLSINKKSLRYFIERSADHTLLFFGEYMLQSVSTTNDLAAQLLAIFAKDSFLLRAFIRVSVCWYTEFEIIPAIFLDISELATDAVYNEIINGEAYFVFQVPDQINKILIDKFDTITHFHSGSVIIEQLRKSEIAKSNKLFINIHSDTVEIIYFDDNASLKIYNRYEYKTYQDYIYFVLLVADEMKINREEVTIVLIGEIDKESQLYEIMQRYFMHISFINRPESVGISKHFNSYPPYFNYQIYNMV